MRPARFVLGLVLFGALALAPAGAGKPPNGSIVVAVVEPSVSCAIPVPGSKPLGRGSSWHCTFSGSATTSFGRARANGRIELKTSRSGITTVQGRLTLGYGGATGRTTISLLMVRAGTSSTVINVESPPGSWQLVSGSGDWSGATGKGTYLLALNFASGTKLALHLEGNVKSASR